MKSIEAEDVVKSVLIDLLTTVRTREFELTYTTKDPVIKGKCQAYKEVEEIILERMKNCGIWEGK